MIRHAFIVKRLKAFSLLVDVEAFHDPFACTLAQRGPELIVEEELLERVRKRSHICLWAEQACLPVVDHFRNGSMGETHNWRSNCLRLRKDHAEPLHIALKRQASV